MQGFFRTIQDTELSHVLLLYRKHPAKTELYPQGAVSPSSLIKEPSAGSNHNGQG